MLHLETVRRRGGAGWVGGVAGKAGVREHNLIKPHTETFELTFHQEHVLHHCLDLRRPPGISIFCPRSKTPAGLGQQSTTAVNVSVNGHLTRDLLTCPRCRPILARRPLGLTPAQPCNR